MDNIVTNDGISMKIQSNPKMINYSIISDPNRPTGSPIKLVLKTQNFRWLKEEEYNKIDFLKENENSAFMVDCDLGYPTYIGQSINKKGRRLASNQILSDRIIEFNRFTIHSQSLKWHLENGIVISKIYRVLAFDMNFL